VPGAVGEGAIEGDADAGLAAVGGELGGDDAGVVGDEEVVGAEDGGEVVDVAVGEGGGDVEEAGGVARAGGLDRDAVGREGEVVVARAERGGVSRGNRC
jgi:hypothetical protein